MIRAVLDTNVVVSALIFIGPANAIARAWQERRFTFLVSQALVSEYIRVLHYPKFRLSRAQIRRLAEGELLPFVTPVHVRRVPRAIRADPEDNQVLACAQAGKADVIVSGDHDLLKLKQFHRIPIITLTEFLHRTKLTR